MAINFNSLPDSNNGGLVPKGTYVATIEVAEMKQGKDPAKPPYLNMRYALTDELGKSMGKVYDILVESEHEVIKYKIKRFITALQIPITGEFELKDLIKIIQGKQMIVDITHDTKGDRPRAVVDMFDKEIFYPMADREKLFKGITFLSDDKIDAPDADDVIGFDEY